MCRCAALRIRINEPPRVDVMRPPCADVQPSTCDYAARHVQMCSPPFERAPPTTHRCEAHLTSLRSPPPDHCAAHHVRYVQPSAHYCAALYGHAQRPNNQSCMAHHTWMHSPAHADLRCVCVELQAVR